jgi:hypothetical protein
MLDSVAALLLWVQITQFKKPHLIVLLLSSKLMFVNPFIYWQKHFELYFFPLSWFISATRVLIWKKQISEAAVNWLSNITKTPTFYMKIKIILKQEVSKQPRTDQILPLFL